MEIQGHARIDKVILITAKSGLCLFVSPGLSLSVFLLSTRYVRICGVDCIATFFVGGVVVVERVVVVVV